MFTFSFNKFSIEPFLKRLQMIQPTEHDKLNIYFKTYSEWVLKKLATIQRKI